MLASEVFQTVLQQLRSLRTELTTTGDTDAATKVSRITSEAEKWIAEAEQREAAFAPSTKYQQDFYSRHIEPLTIACPGAAYEVVEEFTDWATGRFPDAKPASALEDELADALTALDDAVGDCDEKAAINAAKVIMPLARRLESSRLKSGEYVVLADATQAERELAERLIPVAYAAVTGRSIRLRADTGKHNVGGYVKIDAKYQDSPEWFAVCDALPAEAVARSTVLAAVFNSSLTVPSRWAHARIRLYVEGELQPYTTDEYPWCLEILDERKAKKIYVLKSTQVGVSTVMFIRIIWEVDYNGKTAIYYMPDEPATKKLNIRLENLIEGSEYLAERIDQTNEAKRIGLATLHLEGSKGNSAGRSQPADVIVMDEYDIFDPANAEEIAKRITGSKNGLLIAASTPSFPGVGIDAQIINHAEQVENYNAACPHCSETVVLTYPEAFHREGEYETDPACDKSYVKCPKCNTRLTPDDKAAMLRDGEWALVNPAAERNGVRVLSGLNHLYSSTVPEGEFARASLKTGDEAVAEFHRSNLGKPYIHERGQVTLRTLLNSVSPKYSMANAMFKKAIELDKPPRFLCLDQGRPHTAIVVEMHRTPKQDWHNSYLDSFKFKVLWLEKPDTKQRIMEIAYEWQCWSAVLDIDPDPDLPKHLLHGPDKHFYYGGYIAATRAIEVMANPHKPIDELTEEGSRLLIANIDRSLYYARAIDRINNGNILLPADTPQRFLAEMQGAVKTHRVDQHGQVKLYVMRKDPNRPMDTLSAFQLAEVALELWCENKIGVLVAREDAIRR